MSNTLVEHITVSQPNKQIKTLRDVEAKNETTAAFLHWCGTGLPAPTMYSSQTRTRGQDWSNRHAI